ncbi:MAG TPA: hypothetical protein DHV94_09135 [Clostridiales bacterium]|nr:hypothetical protein [Clostridiales bacterium]
MFHQQHRRLILPNQRLQLHPAEHVDVVQRLIPHKHMRRLAQRPRQQDFLPLSLAHFLQIVSKQLAWAVHVPQNRLEERFVHLRIADEVAQTAAQIIHPLPHGRERHTRRNADIPRQRVTFAQNPFEDAGLSAPVRADKRQPLALTQRKPHVFADCPIPVANRAVFHRNQHVFRMRQRRHAQHTDLLDVFQQRLLFLDGAFLPHLRCFRAFHHPLRCRTEETPVNEAVVFLIRMALVFLRAIAPFRRFARCGFQLLDFFAERVVPGGFGFVFAVQACFKRVVISLHDVGVRLVQADHMVNRAVEEGAVMADEQKAVFAAQVVCEHCTTGCVEGIGGFVDEQIGVLAGE